MHVHITARHIELTPALADYVQKKLERVARHFKAVIRAQVVLSVEKRRHIAEVVCHAADHHDFRAQGESADLYAAVDLVTEKFHKHMSRQKDRRVKSRQGGRGEKIRQRQGISLEMAAASLGTATESVGPVISRVSRFVPKLMTSTEAAEEMQALGYNFILFVNEDDVNVLYRRKDGTFGLLEPNLS